MRQDVGLSTIAIRLAGMRPAPIAPATAPAGGQSFATALSAQGAAGVLPADLGPAAANAFGPAGLPPGLVSAAIAPAPQLLGQGARFAPDGALITPTLPGSPGAVGGAIHSCTDCGGGAGAAGGVGAAGSVATAGGGVLGTRRSGPPPELVAHGNGRIPPTALEPLGTGDHMLWSPAARAFRDLSAAAARDGVSIGINSSYRSYEGQVEMVERYGLYSQGGRAAQPGTSNHGWGVSVDLQLDDRGREWMRANASRFGFAEDVPREPWHWTFTASSY